MKCSQRNDSELWRVELGAIESNLLTTLFQRALEQYRQKVDSLPEAVQQHLRGSISKEAEPEKLREEQEALQAERLAWRGERLVLLEKWMGDYLRSGVGKSWTFDLTRDELEGLLMILNDRRLLLATEHGLDEEEMEAQWEKAMDVNQRLVLGEIDLLTQFLGSFLMALNPDMKIEPDEES
jgi:hypothetical protein